jgi:hypothetical protein
MTRDVLSKMETPIEPARWRRSRIMPCPSFRLESGAASAISMAESSRARSSSTALIVRYWKFIPQ